VFDHMNSILTEIVLISS